MKMANDNDLVFSIANLETRVLVSSIYVL